MAQPGVGIQESQWLVCSDVLLVEEALFSTEEDEVGVGHPV